MAEKESHHIRRHSSRKPRPQLNSPTDQPRRSFSSPNSPTFARRTEEFSSRSRHLWNRAIEGVLEHGKTLSSAGSTTAAAFADEPTGWHNLTKRVMQLNANPTLTTTPSPAAQRENWQQRRYNFLSKYSMFGGELKDEIVEQNNENEEGNNIGQRPMNTTPQLVTPECWEPEPSKVKRESIFGMAVSGVRNLLTDNEDEEQPNTSTNAGKYLSVRNKSFQQSSVVIDPVTTDKVDGKETSSDPGLQTDSNLLPVTTVIVSEPSSSPSQQPFRSFAKIFSRRRRSSISKQRKRYGIHDSYRSYRPYFTYWVTFVQVIVCIVSLAVYGHAPLSFVQPNNASIFEQPRFDLTMNPWLGPYPADLIRLGAKYTPCMRQHDEVQSRYEKQARVEVMSGCCVNSKTGRCMQTLSQQCLPRSGLMWYQTAKRSKNQADQTNVIYPAVCGLTPETCIKKLYGNIPRVDESSWTSTVANSKILKWSSSAIEWPICLEQDHTRISHNYSLYPHMQCSNIARPCCTGVLGDCMLTSKEDCRRRRGIFHSRAHLCSQVDCIQSICGMLEFFVARLPDQVYRFWTVIFIHAGLIHLVITIIFQYTIMRPLEKLAGGIRVMIIYIVSGFVGSIASALFLRDSIQVGPGGGQFAILACYLSELFLGWRSLKRPWIPFFKIIICLFLLLTVGLLPLVDNYSQCFGFLMGFMLNMIVFPDVSYRKNVRHLMVVTISLAITIALFVALITLFYTVPFKCASCQFLSCPFGQICGVDKR